MAAEDYLNNQVMPSVGEGSLELSGLPGGAYTMLYVYYSPADPDNPPEVNYGINSATPNQPLPQGMSTYNPDIGDPNAFSIEWRSSEEYSAKIAWGWGPK